MALPSLHKTWQGGTTLGGTDLVNQVISGGEANVLLAIKQALTTFDQNPWTVVGSCDSTAFSMDGTDRWALIGDLVYRNNSNDPHSWIVLQQANINAKFQVCISLDDTLAFDSDRSNVTLSFSSSAGFGAANGGTDGALNTKPTATDEIYLNFVDWMGAAGNVDMMLTCIQSTDGECTRIIISHESTSTPYTAIGFEVPRLPPSNWSDPCVAYIFPNTSGCFQQTNWQDNSWIKALLTDWSDNYFEAHLHMMAPMVDNTEANLNHKQVTGPVKFFAGSLAYDGADAPFDLGTLFDWYWVSRNVSGNYAADLDTFPAAGNRTFVCLGDMVIGWLNDSTTDLKYDNA